MKKRIAFYSLLVCINLALIWGNSSLPAVASSEISGGVLAWLHEWFAIFGALGEHLLRKLGHFSEFALLGLLLTRLLHQLLGQKLSLPVLCGLLTACIDETIQLFPEGRSSSLVDVWIDMAGLCCGILFLFLLTKVLKIIFDRSK